MVDQQHTHTHLASLTFFSRGLSPGYSLVPHLVFEVFVFVVEEAERSQSHEEGCVHREGRVPGGQCWLVTESRVQVHHLVIPAENRMGLVKRLKRSDISYCGVVWRTTSPNILALSLAIFLALSAIIYSLKHSNLWWNSGRRRNS